MSDLADMSDDQIEAERRIGIKRAEDALKKPSLQPIIETIEGTTRLGGLCHHCASPINPGHLFCPVDKEDPDGSCVVLWEAERQRRGRAGR